MLALSGSGENCLAALSSDSGASVTVAAQPVMAATTTISPAYRTKMLLISTVAPWRMETHPFTGTGANLADLNRSVNDALGPLRNPGLHQNSHGPWPTRAPPRP